jgi:membrane-associated phospholipid phosphatase
MADDGDSTAEKGSQRGHNPEPVSEVERLDVAAGREIAKRRHHPAAKAAAKASEVGDQGPLYAFSAGLLIAGLATRNGRLARSGVAMLAAVGFADVAKRVAKGLVRRTRPHVLLDQARYETDAGGSGQKPEQSFPSGHTACSLAAARALSRTFPEAGAVAGVAAVAIGVSRIAKGAHWPLDVVAGAVIGLAAEAMSTQVLERLSPKLDPFIAQFTDVTGSVLRNGRELLATKVLEPM